ncbi:MAG: ABC transporter family substrate-binding protein [Kutzneria sp.]|nr:ABC transporter family substrate-binding protein [Kutzneria sp.]
MSRRTWVTVLAAMATTTVLLTACGGAGGNQLQAPDQDNVGHNAMNPHPASDIKDGGTLQWPLDTPVDNWNRYQVDGTTLDEQRMQNTLFPWLFTENPDTSVKLNPDYLTSATMLSTDPEVIEYKLNPKAKWSNGRPISWQDFRAQWQALNGTNPAYQVSDTAGYENIAAVERGTDDQDVKVTYATKFGEWRGVFSPLYPMELNSSPEEFNTGWVTQPKITSGPFTFGAIDQTAKTVRVDRDPAWWGTKPHLDSILFKVVDRSTLPDALASGAIDWADANGSVDALTRFRNTPNVALRQAVTPDTFHVTTNGAPGRILADQRVRLAVLKAIDRQAIANAMIGKIIPNPKTLGNHFFPQGSANYVDHGSQLTFDKSQAGKDLDATGWTRSGQYRTKDGKELDLNYVSSSTEGGNNVGKLLQQQLAEIGVKVVINAVPTVDFFKKYVNVGDFDLTAFRWFSNTYPLSGAKTIYKIDLANPRDVQQNYGHVGSAEINDLYDRALAELNDTKRAELTQEIDNAVWKIGGELPLYQVPGASAVRDTVANWGAPGFAYNPIDYASIGFLK